METRIENWTCGDPPMAWFDDLAGGSDGETACPAPDESACADLLFR
jgi:hypothetical protein